MKNIARVLFFSCLIKPLLNFFIGINVFNHNNLLSMAKQQVIIIANHNSHLDTPVLMNLFPLSALSKVRPVAAADYFGKTKIINWFVQTFLNVILIPRNNFTKNNNPLVIMGEEIKKGNSLIIFPEGTRGEPEKLNEFQNGIAHIIKKFPHIPVIIIFMKGMGKSLPKGEVILIPLFCDVIIGQPKLYEGDKEHIMKQMEKNLFELKEELKRILDL